MKVFVNNPIPDRGMRRIAKALIEHAPPEIEIVYDPAFADLVVLYAYGRRERLGEQVRLIKEAGKKYAVVQLALRSTMTPHTSDWIPLWKDAEVVWSYYNLLALCEEDLQKPNFRFYHSPLGTDFDTKKNEDRFLIACSGRSYLTESVRECIKAADTLGGKVFNVGPQIRGNVASSNGMGDWMLQLIYSQCKFVSGLRRIEGFEFPVIEGLMCGARPICFDRPHYQQWFHDLAIFIPEVSREETVANLINVFEHTDDSRISVTPEEKEIARKRFDWATIIQGFYQSL